MGHLPELLTKVNTTINSFMTEVPIISKPMDRFLYDRDLHHERVLYYSLKSVETEI